MDAKSAAKSKRAHSQHGRKTHQHHPNPKLSSVSSTDGKTKLPQNKNREKPRNVLPSNWDRYREEENSENQISEQEKKYKEFVEPKSKGADFKFLISQAQEQNSNKSIVPSFDDDFPDFYQGLSALISVRGEILSSFGVEDNFIVDGDTKSNYEASFLSMDLQTIDAQLAKVNIAKRLFIEEDILPEEMKGEKTSEPDNMVEPQPYESQLHVNAERKQVVDKEIVLSTSPSKNDGISPNLASRLTLDKVEGSKSNDISGQNEMLESCDLLDVSQISHSETKPSMFKAKEAEAELDLLLDSLGENHQFDSFNIPKESSDESTKFFTSSLEKQSISNLDGAIDDLLEETLSITVPKTNTNLQNSATISMDKPSYSLSGPSSKVFDDFDSWLDTI